MGRKTAHVIGSRGMTRRSFAQAIGAGAVAVPPRTLSSASAEAQTPARAASPIGKPDEICDLSAVDMAARIRRRELSAREVMAAHLARIERINPKVNAIVTLVAERAMADARRADEQAAGGRPLGVLHGLPVAHKDLVDTAGIRTTRGSRFLSDNVPKTDALIVTRIRAAGAITCGKTNTPEYGAGSQTFNAVFGRDPQPLRPDEDLRRQQWRCGGFARLRHGPDCRRQRHGWVVAQSRGLLQCRRPAPVTRACAGRRWVLVTLVRAGADGTVRRRRGVVSQRDCRTGSRSPISLTDDPARFRAPLDRDFKGVRVAWWQGLGGIPFEADIRRSRRRHSTRVRGSRLPGRGRGTGLRRRRSGVSRAALCRQSSAVFRADSEAARMGEGHDQVRSRAGGAPHWRRPRTGNGAGRRGCTTRAGRSSSVTTISCCP